METHSMNEKLLTEADVAEWLGYSPRTVQGWRLNVIKLAGTGALVVHD